MKGFAFFAGFAAFACAQHLGLEIPMIEEVVEESLHKFHEYIHYQAPPNAPPKPTGKPHNTNAPAASCSFWLDEIPHSGVAAFNSNSSYQVYRNVMDFGATGNGQTDDSAAINAAISSGNRCAPGSCQASTTTPAVVYFPPGTYLISEPIIDYYMTQLIGNPNCLPTIRAAPNFSSPPGSLGLIDADPYQNGGAQGYGSTNIFWRRIQNFIIDTTQVAAGSTITGIHWPTAQATSVQNVIFNLNTASGTQHQGMFIENGSAGVLEDLVFNGGLYGLNVGNQQYTMRNLTFNGNVHAIYMGFDWGFTWQGIHINNAQSGILINNVDGTGNNVTEVGSIVVLDSSFTNCPTAIVANRNSNVNPKGANQVILENVALNNVPVVVSNAGVTALAGTSGSSTITAWGQGISYTPSGPNNFQGNIPVAGNGRPSSLLSGSNYFTMPKPQYSSYSTSQIITVRSKGAKGDGKTDDTTAFQNAINAAVSANALLFVDQGDYLVTKTIYFPPGLKITGEAYPAILSSGSFFNNMNRPQPVVQIGNSGQIGSIQWSNMLVSTQGQQQGAILIQYNLNSGSTPSGIWDVHTRIGGFAGSNLQVSQCPTTPGTTVTSSNLQTSCIAAYMSMYVPSGASGLYMANNWLWTADHDVDSASQTQITVYSGRGLLIESQGPIWLVGTAVEHHVKYQYQFVNAKNVYAGFIQTETPYYQPNPGASIPFPTVTSLSDPVFASSSASGASTVDAWGLRIVNSTDILIYGAGHYSFFDNYSTSCSNQGTDNCQATIVNLAGTKNDITIYALNTVGVPTAINSGGTGIGAIANDMDGFVETIGWFTTNRS